ncbi:MAG: SH3 domain-containing protein [Anaerolineales bacterium]|nr:SH3 domain-containing protein [Anaerolineales bacterium]
MEGFLRQHGGFRTLLLLGLIAGIAIEGFLIYSKLNAQSLATQGDPTAGPSAGPLTCVVRSDVHLRTGPTVEYEILTTLSVGQRLEASARNGDTPWLRIRTESGQEGWSSTWSRGGVQLIECEGEIGELPEEQVESAPAATEVVFASPTPKRVLEPPSQIRVDNGPDLLVVQGLEVAIDGDLSEWGPATWAPIANVLYRSENWNGNEDLSGQVAATWNDDALIFAVRVTDDVLVQDAQDEEYYKGDSIEFFIDRDLEGDFDVAQYNGDDLQGVVTPGNFEDRSPAARVWTPATTNFANEMQLAAQRTEDGYAMEFSVPWARIGVVPQAGAYFGYAIALSDDDTPKPSPPEQETQMSTSTRLPYPTPPHWGNMILQP